MNINGVSSCASRECNHSKEPLTELSYSLLKHLGEDPHREGLLKTPERFASSLRFLCSGYEEDPEQIIGDALFHAPSNDLVIVKDVEFYSLCEHHLLPFFGRAHVAYIPDASVVGLSKIPRLIDCYARRLQVQERLTSEVADAIFQIVKPKGVAVAIQATHLCMAMRGAQKQQSSTQTLVTRGVFRDDPSWNGQLHQLLL